MRQGILNATVLAGVLLGIPYAVDAASLMISPATGLYRVGDLFSVLANVNTAGQDINAASGQINFDNTRLDVESVGYSRSIFTIWTQEPTYSNAAGTLSFSGGLPSPGFNGSSGAILRITFRARATGQAAVNFRSGSVLANDGFGTNIASEFSGGIYEIIEGVSASPKEAVTMSAKGETVAERTLNAPLLTDWPRSLEAGQNLKISGLGFPNTKILVSVQKGSGDPTIEETFTGFDGRFTFIYSEPVGAGFYRTWARNITPDGLVSNQSEVITVEVTQPLFFRIGTIALNYASVIVTLLALVFFAIFAAMVFWWKIRQIHRYQGREISEAERAVHEGFDAVANGLRKYIRYLAGGRSPKGVERRGAETEEMIEKDIRTIERGIGKEIRDIRHPKKKESPDE